MSFTRYCRTNFGELLLVWLSSWCVANVGFDAFFLESAAAWRAPASLAMCAVLTLVLFAATFDRRRLAAGIVAYLAVVGATVAACLYLSTGDTPYADAEGNYLYLGVVMAAAVTGCYVLTRTLAGSVVWFIVSTFACSVVQAFYQSGDIAFSVAACLLALALIVYRNFRLGLTQADAAENASGARNLAASVLPVAASVAAALGVWFLVIAPLNPGVLKVTLITDYRQLPIVEVKGVANKQPTLNYDLTSNNLVDGVRYTTDDLLRGASDTVLNAKAVLDAIAAGGQASNASGDQTGAQSGLDRDSTQKGYDASSYTQQTPLALIILGIIAALLAATLLVAVFRRWHRRHRLQRMLAQEPFSQMQSIYLFLVGRLGRIGFAVPEGRTLTEFATESADRMAVLDAETRVPFSRLTETYTACAYGGRAPTEDELVPFVTYYLGFWKAARRYLGKVRYFFKSFRL